MVSTCGHLLFPHNLRPQVKNYTASKLCKNTAARQSVLEVCTRGPRMGPACCHSGKVMPG